MTKDAIHQSLWAGHQVVIITGRDYYGSVHVARELFENTGGLLSSSNGANVYDLKSGRSLIDHTIPRDTAEDMVDYGLSLGFDYIIYYDGKIQVARPDAYDVDYLSKKNKLPIKVDPDLREKIGQIDLNKVLFSARAEEIDKHIGAFRDKFSPIVNPIHSMPQYLDCMPKGINKGVSLLEIADHYGISHDNTIAFGDEVNDIEMIKAAGCGVAMGNAKAELKEMADVVCGTNDADGIGRFILGEVLGK